MPHHSAARAALRDDRFQGEARRVIERARFASRRMDAALRRGSLNSSVLARWSRSLAYYRSRGDWLSSLDFLRKYGAGIDRFCQPSQFDRKAA